MYFPAILLGLATVGSCRLFLTNRRKSGSVPTFILRALTFFFRVRNFDLNAFKFLKMGTLFLEMETSLPKRKREKFFLEKNLSSLKQLVEDLEEMWGARNTCPQEGYACSSALEMTLLTEQ